MNTGAKILLGVVGAGIVIGGGYLAYQTFSSPAQSAPGTNSGGGSNSQVNNNAGNLLNQAGQYASQAGQVANSVKNIIQSVSGQKLSSKPTSLPSDFDAKQYMINNPDVAAARDKAHPNGWTAEAHYLEYGWKEGRSWTKPLYGLGCACDGRLNGINAYNLLN